MGLWGGVELGLFSWRFCRMWFYDSFGMVLEVEGDELSELRGVC